MNALRLIGWSITAVCVCVALYAGLWVFMFASAAVEALVR